MSAVHQSPFRVDSAVDEIGVVERQLGSTVDDVVGRLDAEHETVVLVFDLVLPNIFLMGEISFVSRVFEDVSPWVGVLSLSLHIIVGTSLSLAAGCVSKTVGAIALSVVNADVFNV